MLDALGFSAWMQARLEQVERTLENQLPVSTEAPAALHEGMRYGVLDGGKRVRPLLVYAASEAVCAARGVEALHVSQVLSPAIDLAACAVELIHAYSLIHDDLPCMDNDVLRRGKPTVHVAFGEAQAMLVGDCLQPLAFELLAGVARLGIPAQVSVDLMNCLAHASGSRGMAGGQAIDLQSVGKALDLEQLRQMHELKTGALLRASIQMGALVAAQGPFTVAHMPLEAKALNAYGHAMGLAFQVIDDVLDVEADTATLGKTAGKDSAQNKPTYVSLMGLEPARAYAHELLEQALAATAPLGDNALRLNQLAQLIVLRKS
jgi:farnesyl diphosphate synthase